MSDGETLVQGWFRVTESEPGVFVIEEPLHDEKVKCFVVTGDQRAVLIDAGMGVGDLAGLVATLTSLPLTLLLSHAHWDHVGSCPAFAGQSEVLVHPAQAERLRAGVSAERMRRYVSSGLLGPLPSGFVLGRATIAPVQPTGYLYGGERIDLGGRVVEVLNAPGHTPGLLAFLDRANDVLFSTDAAYPGDLYAQMDDSDLAAYQTTLASFAILAPTLRTVYPSHGVSPMSPTLLPAMRDALAAVVAGRSPDDIADGVAHHTFAGFGILVAAP